MSRPPWGEPLPANRFDLLDGRWPDDSRSVAVVIAHFDQQAELDRTLAGLNRQTLPRERFEVVVADDNSPAAPRVPPGVEVVVNEMDGYHVAAARNLGVRKTTADVVCFLDADTVPEPDYLRRITRLPSLTAEGLVMGRRRYATLHDLPVDARVEEHAPARALDDPAWLVDGYAQTRGLLDADDRSYRLVISSVMACSRWLFDEAGPFDESFDAYAGEDWEWGYRAWLAGAVLAYEPRAVAWHDGPHFAARGDDARRARDKNDQTLRLASTVALPGSRGHALRGRVSDVAVRLPAPVGEAAAFVCCDSLLAELPEATVVVPDGVARRFAADPRVVPATRPANGGAAAPAHDAAATLDAARLRVDLAGPLRVDRGALRSAVQRMASEQLGRLELCDADGAPLVAITSRRARVREERWGRADGFDTARAPAAGLERLPPEPDVEGYLGGWA